MSLPQRRLLEQHHEQQVQRRRYIDKKTRTIIQNSTINRMVVINEAKVTMSNSTVTATVIFKINPVVKQHVSALWATWIMNTSWH